MDFKPDGEGWAHFTLNCGRCSNTASGKAHHGVNNFITEANILEILEKMGWSVYDHMSEVREYSCEHCTTELAQIMKKFSLSQVTPDGLMRPGEKVVAFKSLEDGPFYLLCKGASVPDQMVVIREY